MLKLVNFKDSLINNVNNGVKSLLLRLIQLFAASHRRVHQRDPRSSRGRRLRRQISVFVGFMGLDILVNKNVVAGTRPMWEDEDRDI